MNVKLIIGILAVITIILLIWFIVVKKKVAESGVDTATALNDTDWTSIFNISSGSKTSDTGDNGTTGSYLKMKYATGDRLCTPPNYTKTFTIQGFKTVSGTAVYVCKDDENGSLFTLPVATVDSNSETYTKSYNFPLTD